MSEIKERPILFSAPMVRAILEGRKTVTRRVCKPQPSANAHTTCASGNPMGAWWETGKDINRCPYGKPGDRMWVRETFAFADKSGSHDGAPDDHWRPARPGMEPEIYRCWYRASDGHAADGFWKPSIHMPRWASRILLEITAVRVERLQDISEEQAKAEGCFFTDYGRKCGHTGSGWTDIGDCPAPEAHHPQRNGWMWDRTSSPNECLGTATWAFANLWQKTGGAWEANPWVWVVEFRPATP